MNIGKEQRTLIVAPPCETPAQPEQLPVPQPDARPLPYEPAQRDS